MIAPYAIPRLAHHARRRDDPVTGRPLLLYPEGALELDPVAAAIVDRCDGRTALSEIAAALAAAYAGDPADIARDVAACLGDLAARGLIVAEGP